MEMKKMPVLLNKKRKSGEKLFYIKGIVVKNISII